MICRMFALLLTALVVLALALPPDVADARTPINIRVKSPDRLGPHGVLLSGNWALVLELEVRNAVGIVDDGNELRVPNMALIIDDPDDCIHMAGWIGIGDPSGAIEGCAGTVDETFIRFTPDAHDAPGIDDMLDAGIEDLQDMLSDDPFDAMNLANLDRQYYDNGFGGGPTPFVGASTESSMVSGDGYGYGVNDDVPNVYIWADIGTGRVTDPLLNSVSDPETGATKLRNMAGLISGVYYNQLTAGNRTSIVLVMNVARGVLEPIVQFDFIGVDPMSESTSTGFHRKIDGGPLETVLFPDATERFQDEAYEEVFASLEPYEVKVGAAVVEGDARPFIHDMDGNGRYNRRDLVLMGHTLLSNVGFYRVRAIQFEALDTGHFECPNGFVFKEASLDSDPHGEIGCATGSARSIVRRPR